MSDLPKVGDLVRSVSCDKDTIFLLERAWGPGEMCTKLSYVGGARPKIITCGGSWNHEWLYDLRKIPPLIALARIGNG